MDPAFALDSFQIRFRDGSALGPWTFSLARGAAGVLCGPSGSGKTRLLYSLAGLHPEGTGPCATAGRREVTAPVDVLFEKPFLQVLGPTVRQELAMAQAGSWMPRESRHREMARLLESFSLGALRDRPVRELSEGERQRLALGCLFLRAPSLLLLDQPASSLDPGGREALRSAMARAADRGASVLAADPDWPGFAPADAERMSLLPGGPVLRPGAPEGGLLDGPAAGGRPGPGETLLSFQGLEVRRGARTVLRDVSGRVSQGEIIGLVGDNGSGKTSLLLTLAGLLKTRRGRLLRPGLAARRFRRPRPALMLQEALWHLSGQPVRAELAWAAKGRPPGPEDTLTRSLPVLLGIHPLLGRSGFQLSRGEMQRVVLAMTLLRPAPLICLDEPLRFLWDPERKTLGRLFQALRDRGFSLLVTSPLEDLLPWADRIWRLAHGRMEDCRNTSACDS